MIHELNKSLSNLILVETKEDKLNYLLLGGDETKRWVNAILYSLKKGS
jgi:vacuolar-type H+-ATPase subunit D/Vma8